MGGCESCASGRRKEVERLIDDARRNGDSRNLRDAIREAEAEGMDVLAARQLYAEMAKQERQSPERAQEMLRWASSTQDGVILRQVIEEVETLCPDSLSLVPARKRLQEYQEEMKRRLCRTQDNQKLSFFLDRARQMGIPAAELVEHVRRMEEGAARASKSSTAEPPLA
mmetsp:Transcript_51929/g.63583  ORF Transcript_51929/g.63583 Transcript_51929/m.63583 type:complete len:169 (-) Transcript_51929:40-546(-)